MAKFLFFFLNYCQAEMSNNILSNNVRAHRDINKDSAKRVGRDGNWDPGKTESAFLRQSLQMSPERTVSTMLTVVARVNYGRPATRSMMRTMWLRAEEQNRSRIKLRPVRIVFLSLYDNQVKALSGNMRKGTQQFVGNYREIPGALKYNHRSPTHSTRLEILLWAQNMKLPKHFIPYDDSFKVKWLTILWKWNRYRL